MRRFRGGRSDRGDVVSPEVVMTIEYMVCDSSAIDANGNCTQVQYVQAPVLIPPLDATSGVAIAMAIWGLWALAASWRTLGK